MHAAGSTPRGDLSDHRRLDVRPSSSARCFTGLAVSAWPRPAGRSGCVYSSELRACAVQGVERGHRRYRACRRGKGCAAGWVCLSCRLVRRRACGASDDGNFGSLVRPPAATGARRRSSRSADAGPLELAEVVHEQLTLQLSISCWMRRRAGPPPPSRTACRRGRCRDDDACRACALSLSKMPGTDRQPSSASAALALDDPRDSRTGSGCLLLAHSATSTRCWAR